MKKSRPATQLSVLCNTGHSAALKAIVFENTTTIGLREYTVQKNVLRREERTIATALGDVRVKESYFKGKRVNAKPEFEDCKQLAEQHRLSISEVEKEISKHL
jgi:uncharacterized protein (DUF111 family)